jgi:DNA-binding transcriptional regulator YdaS (Cro superfamily)
MVDFVTAAFRASLALGGPSRLARRLGVPPDQLYRWMAGVELPAQNTRRDLRERITCVLAALPVVQQAQRRHGDASA